MDTTIILSSDASLIYMCLQAFHYGLEVAVAVGLISFIKDMIPR